jgi:hypothetical protein
MPPPATWLHIYLVSAVAVLKSQYEAAGSGGRPLTEQRTCRVATASQDGPHLTPLWHVWDGTALWLYSVVRSQRWTDISRITSWDFRKKVAFEGDALDFG